MKLLDRIQERVEPYLEDVLFVLVLTIALAATIGGGCTCQVHIDSRPSESQPANPKE